MPDTAIGEAVKHRIIGLGVSDVVVTRCSGFIFITATICAFVLTGTPCQVANGMGTEWSGA